MKKSVNGLVFVLFVICVLNISCAPARNLSINNRQLVLMECNKMEFEIIKPLGFEGNRTEIAKQICMNSQFYIGSPLEEKTYKFIREDSGNKKKNSNTKYNISKGNGSVNIDTKIDQTDYSYSINLNSGTKATYIADESSDYFINESYGDNYEYFSLGNGIKAVVTGGINSFGSRYIVKKLVKNGITYTCKIQKGGNKGRLITIPIYMAIGNLNIQKEYKREEDTEVAPGSSID